LPRIARGELTGTLALVEASGRWDAEGVTAPARPDGDGYLLSGSKLFVPEATNADLIVWVGRTGGPGEDGVSLFLVERDAPGVTGGSFQAVKHMAADMKVSVENMRSIAYYAAWTATEGRAELPLTASMAKAYCSDAGRQVTGLGIQIHGGIGFTWDCDMHLYFKHAFALANSFGDAMLHRERVTSLIESGMEATAGAVAG